MSIYRSKPRQACVAGHGGQARAKVELREFVTEQDAKDVVDMMQEVRAHVCTL